MIELKSTLREAPLRVVVFGKDGTGKSTFCSQAPGAVFIPVESGLDNIDAIATKIPESWKDIIDLVDALGTEDRCKTIVIDALDGAEQLCHTLICKRGDSKGPKRSISDFGYGDGYTAALNEWRILLAALTRARNNGKNILLIAHAERKTIKNPTGEDYESWCLKMNAKAAGLIREWVDVVGFAELDVATVEDDKNKKRHKGLSTGKMVLRTQPAAGHEAKTRFALPAKIPLTWQAFAAAIKAGSYTSRDELRTELERRLKDLANPEVEAGARTFLESRGETVAALKEALATVQAYLDETTEEKEAT